MSFRSPKRLASSSLTLLSIRSRTSRCCSGGISLGSGIYHPSRRLAWTSGHSSPQPIVTATSTSWPLNWSSDFEVCLVRS